MAKIDQGLSAVTTAVAVAGSGQRMTTRGEGMLAAAAGIAIGGGAGTLRIEAVGGAWDQAEQPAHDKLPFAAMGLC